LASDPCKYINVVTCMILAELSKKSYEFKWAKTL
jgi:hypothetical protein